MRKRIQISKYALERGDSLSLRSASGQPVHPLIAFSAKRSYRMDLRNIGEATEWFEVLQTSRRSQTAMMTLAPGDSTGRKAEAHEKSDQVLLMLSGALSGKVGGETVQLAKGDVLLIPAGTPHRFRNPGRKSAVTFNVYSPAEYPVGMKG